MSSGPDAVRRHESQSTTLHLFGIMMRKRELVLQGTTLCNGVARVLGFHIICSWMCGTGLHDQLDAGTVDIL